MSRDDAYSIVQGAAMQAWEGEGDSGSCSKKKKRCASGWARISETSSTPRTRCATWASSSRGWRN